MNNIFQGQAEPILMRDDEITYGPRKLGLGSRLFSMGLVLLGVFLFASAASDHSHGFVRTYWAVRDVIGGLAALFLGVIGCFVTFSGKRKDFPRVTLYSTGLSYKMGPKTTFEARWDSVKPFKLVYDSKSGGASLQAPITGRRVSENLQGENIFGIFFLNAIDVDPDVLLSEINQVRAGALKKQNR